MKDYFIKHRNEIFLILILFIAISVRFLFLLEKEVPIFADSVLYAESGKNFIETGNYSTFSGDLADIIFPPGYPIAVGITDHFFNDPLFSLRFVSFVFGCLLIYLFYLTGKEMRSKEAGLFASFFAATNSSLILFSQEVFTESMFFFFILFSFYLYLKLGKKSKTKFAIFLGFSIGISYLVRPEGLLLLVLPFMYLFNIIRKFQFKIIICFLLVFVSAVAVMSPYIYFLSQKTGKIVLTTKANSNLVHGIIFNGAEKSRIDMDTFTRYEENESNYNEETNSLDYPKEEYKNTGILTAILDENFLIRYIRGFESELFVLLVDHWVDAILLFIILAIFCALGNRKYRQNVSVLLIISVILLSIFPIFHIESRYMAQVLIFLILLASLGYSIDIDLELKSSKTKLLARKAVSAIKISVLILISAQFIIFIYISIIVNNPMGFCNSATCFNSNVRDRYFPPTEESLAFEYKLAGEYIKHDSSSARKRIFIMSGRPIETSFYAGADNLGIMLPDTSAQNILKFAEINDVNYIVVDKRYLGVRKNYNDLVNLEKFSKDIELIFEDDSVSPIRVFKIK